MVDEYPDFGTTVYINDGPDGMRVTTVSPRMAWVTRHGERPSNDEVVLQDRETGAVSKHRLDDVQEAPTGRLFIDGW